MHLNWLSNARSDAACALLASESLASLPPDGGEGCAETIAVTSGEASGMNGAATHLLGLREVTQQRDGMTIDWDVPVVRADVCGLCDRVAVPARATRITRYFQLSR